MVGSRTSTAPLIRTQRTQRYFMGTSNPSPANAPARRAAKDASIFIIDDDRSLLGLLRVIFEDAELKVRTFLDAQQALEAVKLDQPDAIVLDLEMPVMNGRAFYHAVRAEGIETPILILSAYGARAAQVELGANAYVDKPFEPDQLIDVVMQLLESA
jgi:DNA-binding response OmpR family regulator